MTAFASFPLSTVIAAGMLVCSLSAGAQPSGSPAGVARPDVRGQSEKSPASQPEQGRRTTTDQPPAAAAGSGSRTNPDNPAARAGHGRTHGSGTAGGLTGRQPDSSGAPAGEADPAPDAGKGQPGQPAKR